MAESKDNEALALIAAAFDRLAARLGDGQQENAELIGEIRRLVPPREVQYGDADYQAKVAAERRVFKTKTFQHGFEITEDAKGLSDETIDRVSKLRAGRYIHGVVLVDVSHKGEVRISYSNKTPDQRMARMLDFRDFTDLINQIWAEMQATATAALAQA